MASQVRGPDMETQVWAGRWLRGLEGRLLLAPLPAAAAAATLAGLVPAAIIIGPRLPVHLLAFPGEGLEPP